MGMAAQLRCSIWRYYLTYLRQWPWVLGALLAAVVPFLLLVGLRFTAVPRHHDVCHFPSRTLSMESPLSVVQSFVCSLPNTCHQDGQDDLVDTYPGAAINVLLNSSLWSGGEKGGGMVGFLESLPTSLGCLSQLAAILTNPRLTNLMENGLLVHDVIKSPDDLSQELTINHDLDPAVVEAILGAKLNISRIMSLVGYRDMRWVVCSPGQLTQFMVIQNTSQIDNISISLCNLPNSSVANITQAFVNSLDAEPLFRKVSEVLDAIGGYEAETLVHQVGGLLVSLGRLEALAPLASTLNVLTSALQPLMEALATLTTSGWNSQSLNKLLNIAERVSLAYTGSTAALNTTRSAALLLSPRSFIGSASQQATGDPWEKVLEVAASKMEVLVKEVGMASETLSHNPTAHTLLMAATALLPTLLGPTLPNTTRFGESLDLVTTRMLPEVSSPVLSTLAASHLAVIMATNITEATDIMLSWVMTEPQLPLLPSFAVIATFTNTSLLQKLITEDKLVSWICNKTSWSNISDADWQIMKTKFCNDDGGRKLQRLMTLLKTPLDQTLMDRIQSQKPSASASQTLQSFMMLLEKIQSSTHLLQFLQLDQVKDLYVETIAGRKRSESELQLQLMNEIIEGVKDIPEETGARSKRFISDTNDATLEQELSEWKKIQVFKDDIQLKYIIKNLMAIYLNLAKEAELIGKHLPEDIQNILKILADPQAVENMAGLMSSVLDVLARVATIAQQPETLGDVILTPQLKKHLLFFLNDTQEVVETMNNLMEAPQLNMPPPIPQLLGVLNVTYNLLSKFHSEEDMWGWCEGGCHYMAGLAHQVGLLPRILALPYLWGIHGLTSEMVVLLNNETAWREYPCGETTLVNLFPLPTAVKYLPPTWSHLETIKKDIQNLEHYLCENFTFVVRELMSNTQLNESLRVLVEDLVSREVDVGDAFHLIRSFRQLLTLIEPQKFLANITTPQGTSILQEFHDAFAEPLVNPRVYMSKPLDLMDQLLVWMGRDTQGWFIIQTIQYAIYHAYNIIKAVNDILKDNPSSASLLGLQQDYPPLLLLSQGPQGTADFLIQELTFIADLDEPLEWSNWASRLCNQSVGVSAMLEVVCYFAQHPKLPDLHPNLTTAIVEALTDYQNPEIQVPELKLVEFYEECLVLIKHIQESDFDRPLNLSGLEKFWNASLLEAYTVLPKLSDLWKKWLWEKADAAIAESRELQEVMKKSYTVLAWLHNMLPDTLDNLTEGIPPHVIKLHNTVNSSWIDLLDGLHHNILINPVILNITHLEFCSSTTNLKEPPEGSGHFQEAVGEVCSIIGNFSQIDLNIWLQYENLLDDLKNETWQLSTLDLYNLATSVSHEISTVLSSLAAEEENYTSVFESDKIASNLSFPLKLPSYLIKENWNILLRRIGERHSESNLTNVVPAVEMALGWIGVEQDALTSFKKMASLQESLTKHITASDLQELVQDFPALWHLVESLTQYVPAALKDILDTVSKEPQLVARQLQVLNSSELSSLCDLDLQQVGDDFQTLMNRLCQVSSTELLQNISSFMGLELLQSSLDIPLEEVINSSLVITSLLAEQVQDGSLLQKFSDPVKYLGLQNWVTVPYLVFNMTTQEMLRNSTMMMATLLEPLVELSREPTDSGAVVKAVLKNLNKYLRQSRFILALYRGGNVWEGIKEVYVDKPIVAQVFDMIENLPESALEFLNFFGDYSPAVLSQNTSCSQFFPMLNGQPDFPWANATYLLNTLNFLCDHQQMSLLASQILPESSPIIANVTMEVDAAMLSLLIENVFRDAVSLFEGSTQNSGFQVPSWMDSQEWEKVLLKLKTLLDIPVKEVLAIATSSGLDGIPHQGDGYIASGASLVYHLASRLDQSINDSTGIFNASVLVEGLGTLEDLKLLITSRLPNLVATVLWFPESKVYYRLVSGVDPSIVYEEMCCTGVSETLLHPNLLEEDWLELQRLLCSYTLQQLSEDVEPLLNTSKIVTGGTIEWMRVFSSLDNLLGKFRALNLHQFQNLLVNNPFMVELRTFTPVQQYVRGILSGMATLQQWTFGDDALSSRHNYALFLLQVTAALTPIAKAGVPSLYERLIDPDFFEELIKDYALIGHELQEEVAELNLQYLQQNGSVFVEVELEEGICANQSAVKNISHAHLLSELRKVILNLTGFIMPLDITSEMTLTVEDFLMNVSSNFFVNMAGVIDAVKTPACYFIFSREEFAVPLQHAATWLFLVQKHLEQWENYVDLVCNVARTNLTHTLMKLLQEFNMEDDIKHIVIGNQAENSSVSCRFVFNQSARISEQVEDMITYYLKNESAQIHLQTCLVSALNSTAGLQFRGLLDAAGDLFSSPSSKNITEALSLAVISLPGASSAFRTLGSRVAVMVPFEKIFVKDYEKKLNFSTEVITIIKNDLLVDVNRIYGIESHKFVSLLSSLENMKRWLRMKSEGNENKMVKRSTQAMPLETLYQAIQDMGQEFFAENILKSVNYTYLLAEIDNMRMQVLMSSDWLDPLLMHMNTAVASLSELSNLGAVMDLNKIIMGQVDPVTFLTGSVQLLQMKLWNDLSKSFSGILGEMIPIIAGSELGDDLQQVVDGISGLQAAKNLGIVDFTIPMTALIANWTDMQQYLEDVLMMDQRIIHALKHSKLNLLALLSLEDITVEEVVCEESQVESVITLPQDTVVTPANLSNTLCNSNDSQGLAATFLQHLDLAPLIVTMTKLGLNSSLSSHGMTLEQVMESLNTFIEAFHLLPVLSSTFKTLQGLTDLLRETQMSEKLVNNNTQSILGNISSPAFLERAGHVLCGRPLRLLPDSLGILNMNNLKEKPERQLYSKTVCANLYEEIKSLPEGNVLIHYIKPLLTGKIFYAPNNSITQRIIAEANETFRMAEAQQEVLKRLQESAAQLVTTRAKDSDLQRLEEAMQTSWVQNVMQQLLPTSLGNFLMEQIEQTSPQLKEAPELAKEFSDILEVGVNLISCMDMQRFVPANDEAELLEKAQQAYNKKEFLAGIVFHGVGETGNTEGNLPSKLTYSIRVDQEKSPSTLHLGPRFWRPGPYADMAFHMQYHQGFLQLQETIERAILKLQYRKSNANHNPLASALKDHKPALEKSENWIHKNDKQQLSNGDLLQGAVESWSNWSRRTKRATLSLTREEEDMLLNIPIYTKQQPYPCYQQDDFMAMLNESPVLSFIFSFMAFTIFTVFLICQLVQEQESRNRQLQEVMGLQLWLDHLVWLCYSLFHLLIILLLVGLTVTLGGLQPKVTFGILFTFLFCYGLSIVSFCYMVSCLVPSTVLAVFVGVMSLLVFNVPFLSVSVIQAKTPFTIIILICLLPPSAFGFGFRILCQYELLHEGASYNNLWISPVRGSDMTLGLAIIMLLVDSAIFFFISVIVLNLRNDISQYLSTIRTSDLTTQEPVFHGQSSLKHSNEFTVNIFQEDAVHVLDIDPGLKQSLKKGLSFTGLRKIYKHQGKSKVAVDNFNLELYEGQVLALLGHNGAGKTTIISMLTKELKPTAGNIQVYGHDISSAWDEARKLIGLCPQQAVLFPILTVQETLFYYAILKESGSDIEQTHVNTVLVDMGLFNHRNYLVRQLSEGMCRRLCLAIAFIGNSRLVILDEPTSGVDPAARTAMWEVISSSRAGRTILLTTHHLDEAETLADRVAILHKGRLLCVGSPLALKSEYGLGYSLTLSDRHLYDKHLIGKDEGKCDLKVADEGSNMPLPADGTFTVANKGAVWKLLTEYVPNVRLLETVNNEVTYSLPLCDSHGNSNRLPEMFGELERCIEELGFTSLEIRPTSLEDVVIALNAINIVDSHNLAKSRVTLTPELDKEENLKNAFNFKAQQIQDGIWLGLQRLRALLMKRFMHHGRDWHFYMQIFVLPLLFIILAMIGSRCRPTHKDVVPLKLTPNMYNPPSTTFIRTLYPALEPLAEEFLQLSIGKKNNTGKWSTCPEYIAHTNLGLSECNISALDTSSLCKCNGGQCAVDVSNQPSLNDWLLGTRWQHIEKRYGGITLGVEDQQIRNSSGAMVWYDNSGYHALPAYLNMFNNARLQRLLGRNYTITAINKPIKFSSHSLGSMTLQEYVANLGVGLLILVSLTVVCSATVGYVVAERVRGERRVMYVAGITRNTYWTANMLWDILVLFVNLLLTAFVLVIFNEKQFMWRNNLAAFLILSLLYGLSIIPLFYLVEGWFLTEASAVFTFFSTSFGVGLVTVMVFIICKVMPWIQELNYDTGSSVTILQDMGGVIKYLFLVFPPFTFACGIKDLAVSFTKASMVARFGVDLYVSPFSWDTKMEGGLGVHYLSLALWAVVSTLVLFCWREYTGSLYQAKAPAKTVAGEEEDKDVAAERIKIQCGGTSLYDTVLRLVGLGRDFGSPPTTAVSNLFLALKRGECFSLLGLNGAGKTTTFRCLTGDLQPSRGQILINGLILEEALALPHPIMSYCPQSHALDPNLTPREALLIMALIRGFPSNEITVVLEQAIKQLGLSGDDTLYIRQLSGGSKRKLSTALALIGNPLLVLLDEPTTGMDPASRRLVWRAIQSVTQDGRTVLLTSHSMDEVDQLSHRMAIMVNGYFVCMGSPHYLKYKLGDKYTIRLKTNDIEDMTNVVDFLRSQLADVLLKEQHHLTLVAQVSRHVPLQLLFDSLNDAKSMGVTEYDVSQTTLDEVFRVLTSYQGDGQVPPLPTSREQMDLPAHLPLQPAGLNQQLYDSPLQTPEVLFKPSLLTPVECDHESLYDNVENHTIYATVVKASSIRQPSPDLYQDNQHHNSDSGSADDSPEEEWTHL